MTAQCPGIPYVGAITIWSFAVTYHTVFADIVQLPACPLSQPAPRMRGAGNEAGDEDHPHDLL